MSHHHQEHTCCGSHQEQPFCCGHDHREGACCGGHDHQEQGCCCSRGQGEGVSITLSDPQIELLSTLAQVSYLPLTQLLLKSTKSDHLEAVALSPVYLEDPRESMEQVKQTGAMLLELEEYGLISLDFDMELKGYDYQIYRDCAVFALLRQTVEEGRGREDFLYDLAEVERGSMALTDLGYAVVDRLC